MPRGISESDVHNAADEIVASGDRPTVERIRAHLGTGSPNTVTRWLETWWQGLATRLHAHSAHLAIPKMPEPVSGLAWQLWEHALAAARTEAEQANEQNRLQLHADGRALEEQESIWRSQLANHASEAERAKQLEKTAELRLTDSQRACDLQIGQIKDLTSLHSATEKRAERLEAELAALQQRVVHREEAWAAEKHAQTQHVRALEDRAHAEVDRARQEVKAVRNELTLRAQRLEADVLMAREREEGGRRVAAQFEQDAAVQRARADTLEIQLQKANTGKSSRTSLKKASTGARKRST